MTCRQNASKFLFPSLRKIAQPLFRFVAVFDHECPAVGLVLRGTGLVSEAFIRLRTLGEVARRERPLSEPFVGHSHVHQVEWLDGAVVDGTGTRH